MLKTEENIKIRRETVILIIISHFRIFTSKGCLSTSNAMLISPFPTGESLGLQGSYQTRGHRAAGHTGSEVEMSDGRGIMGNGYLQ